MLEDVQSENMFINNMSFLGRYFIETALLVCLHILKTKNGRRDITRRYVLEDVQREDMFINRMGFWLKNV